MKIGDLTDFSADEIILGDILYYSRYIEKSCRTGKMQHTLGHLLYMRYSRHIYDPLQRAIKYKRYENRIIT